MSQDHAATRDVQHLEEHPEKKDVLRRVASLDPRERRILDMIFNGFPNKVIAKRLDVSIRTVEGERHDIFEKFGADTAVDLVRVLSRAGYDHSMRSASSRLRIWVWTAVSYTSSVDMPI